jgi:GNAT superfamily N-acetyltransferase
MLFFVDRVLAAGPDWIVDRSLPEVTAYSSDVAFPMFNLVTRSLADDDEAADLAERVGRQFMARGLPWMWWTTPSHTSPGLEEALIGLGLEPEDVPGMYVALDGIPEVSDGGRVGEVPLDDPGFGRVLIDGFGLPGFVLEPMRGLLGSFTAAEQMVVTARQDGRTVAVATGLITGETLGIYNVTTLADYRGLGFGSAVTAAVMSEGSRRGCTHAILHASAMGLGVYERLGFEIVCPTTHWVWTP